MDTAFQPDAFQENAFQIAAGGGGEEPAGDGTNRFFRIGRYVELPEPFDDEEDDLLLSVVM